MSRKWRVEATITMPKFVPNGLGGKLPPKLNALNAFPEQCLLVYDDIDVWLRCKGSFTRIENAGAYTLLDMEGDMPASAAAYVLYPHLDSKTRCTFRHENALRIIIHLLSFKYASTRAVALSAPTIVDNSMSTACMTASPPGNATVRNAVTILTGIIINPDMKDIRKSRPIILITLPFVIFQLDRKDLITSLSAISISALKKVSLVVM